MGCFFIGSPLPPLFRLALDFLRPDYLFLAVGVVGGACSDVEQTFVQVTKFSKREQLLDLLRSTGNYHSLSSVNTRTDTGR